MSQSSITINHRRQTEAPATKVRGFLFGIPILSVTLAAFTAVQGHWCLHSG